MLNSGERDLFAPFMSNNDAEEISPVLAKAGLSESQTFAGSNVPEQPVLSVVMPVFNGRRFIEEAIDSVAALRDRVALELVVADGASTDGTLDVLRNTSFVRGVSAPDSGVYEGFNRALQLARGRYVQWLNADDVLGERFIPSAISLLEQCSGRVGFVLGNTVLIDPVGEPCGCRTYNAETATDFKSHAQGSFYNINSALFRTELLLRAGPFDQKRFPLAADRDFEFRLCLMECEARTIDETSYMFRRHAGSLTGSRTAWMTNRLANADVYEFWARELELPACWRTHLISSRIDERIMAAYLSLKYLHPGRRKALSAALEEVLQNPVGSMRIVAAKISARIHARWSERRSL